MPVPRKPTPFIGREALFEGRVTVHQLRTQYQLLLPDIYLAGDEAPDLRQRTVAAWLWSHRQGVVAGRAAAALHGTKWIDDNELVDLVWSQARPPDGVRTSSPRLPRNEFQNLDGIRVTTPARTAFDIGRQHPSRPLTWRTVADLDALTAATGINAEEIAALAERHPGARGIRKVRQALAAMDRGAQSPQETRVRLLLIDAGLPRLTTQIPVFDHVERRWYYVDMGWEDLKVGVEYEGDYHRTDRARYVKDIKKRDALTRLGWRVVWVLNEDHDNDILRRARQARETAQNAGN
jgi:very-short-patch-repair endonuclease